MPRILALALVVHAGSLLSCSLARPIPQARVRPGPIFDAPPTKILALATSCDAEEPEDEHCSPSAARAVDIAARMSLEYAGYRVVDSETINLELRAREVQTRLTGVDEVVDTPRLTGRTWADATAAERTELATSMAIDGVISSTIEVGARHNVHHERAVRVSFILSSIRDDQRAWTASCSVDVGLYNTLDQAMEQATRCTVDAATGVWRD